MDDSSTSRTKLSNIDADVADILGPDWQLLDGPRDLGCEELWRLRSSDGRVMVLGRLSAALARDESVRRRWVRDVERVMSCAAPSLAPVLAMGPQPNPRDLAAAPPWRLRVEPVGQPLSEWLARAPVPIDELSERGAALADALHALHQHNAVVRNLHPRDLIWTEDGRVMLADVGLARVDLLSSHTASSLLVSGSAYAAPEQLMRTIVDQRADLYSLGVLLWQAATGELPFGEGPALLRERINLPPLPTLRPDAPPILGLLLSRCLAEQPEDRPDSAAEVAWVLRGGAGEGLVRGAQTICQHCGAAVRLGQRLCLSCGRVGVRFAHIDCDPGRGFGLELVSLREDDEQLANLRGFIEAVAHEPGRVDEFVIGDPSLYAEHELVSRKRLPARLFNDLDRDTAEQLREHTAALGLDVRVVEPAQVERWLGLGLGSLATAIALTVAAVLVAAGPAVVISTVLLGMLATSILLSKASNEAVERRIRPLHRLRAQPAALPASDPLVARLAALLDASAGGPTASDVRALLAELALVVQRLVDRRAQLRDAAAREQQWLTEPIEPLIELIETNVEQLGRIDRELAELDEGTMVRALAGLDARVREPGKRELERQRLLDGLDRLRSLEDQRSAGMHGLLEAAALLRRAGELGLGVHDDVAEHERSVQLALAALDWS